MKGFYWWKQRKQNLVADAVSRQPLNKLEAEAQSDAATVYSEFLPSYTIETTDKLLNGFRNKIILEEERQQLRWDFIIFVNELGTLLISMTIREV